MAWREQVASDPTGWLLEESGPTVRAATLERLLGRGSDDPEVVTARAEAMAVDPIRGILAAQQPDGRWGKPGPGYTPKYTSTVWQVIFLDQLGADPRDPRVRAGCQYIVDHTSARGGGFGCSGALASPPPASSVLHCLSGNLVAALIRLGWGDHEVVRAAIAWSCRAILGGPEVAYFRSGTSGPGFACAANEGRPCAWGACKQLRALARIPEAQRDADVAAAIRAGIDLLLSVDPATADYPRPAADARPSGSWFRPSFPLGYTSDVLESLEVLAGLGYAQDQRLGNAVEWLLAQQDRAGRWPNRRTLRGPLVAPIETPGKESAWVTLRACAFLRARFGA